MLALPPGAPSHALILTLVQALSEGSTEKALQALNSAQKSDVDFELYLTLLLEYMRLILLVRHAPELSSSIALEAGPDAFAEIEKVAKDRDSKISHDTLLSFLTAASRMRFSPIPVLVLELAVLSQPT